MSSTPQCSKLGMLALLSILQRSLWPNHPLQLFLWVSFGPPAESSSATFQNLEDFLILQMPDQNISDFSIWNTCRLGLWRKNDHEWSTPWQLDAIVATSPRCCHYSAALMAAIHFKTLSLTVVVRRPPCFSSRPCLCSCTLCRNVLKRSALNGQESWLAAGSTLISFQFFSIDWWDVLWFHHVFDKPR